MKVLIPIVIGLLVVGCGKNREITPEEKKLIGTYEGIDGNGVSTKYVLLQNGIVEWYVNGKIIEEGITWEKSQDGALHFLPKGGATAIYRINKDGSLTGIGLIKPNGKPFDWPKEKQITYTKIKPDKKKAEKETPSKDDDKNNTKSNPVNELTLREKVVGEYEFKKNGDTRRAVLLENGIVEFYRNGKKREKECKWEISKESEIHVIEDDYVGIFRINPDSSKTQIAVKPIGGKKRAVPKKIQITYKKIK